MVKIDHFGHESLIGTGLLQNPPIRVDDRGASATPFADAINTKEITLIEQRIRTREYGTLGLGQTLKQLRDSGHTFPIYGDGKLPKGSFENLGKLAFHRDLTKFNQPDKRVQQ